MNEQISTSETGEGSPSLANFTIQFLERERNEARKALESTQQELNKEIRQRQEKEKQLEAMCKVVKACMAAMPVGNIQTHTPENLAARIGDLASALASETSENEDMREAIREAHEALMLAPYRDQQALAKLQPFINL